MSVATIHKKMCDALFAMIARDGDETGKIKATIMAANERFYTELRA